MLASGALYESAAFWTGIGLLLAVVAIAISIVLWRIGDPRRLIVYSMPVAAPLLNRQGRGIASSALEVRFQGQPVANPHVVGLRVDSRSRRDIRADDFDHGKPLVFDIGARILSVSNDIADAAVPHPIEFHVVGREIQVSPAMIRRGPVLRVSLVTDGPPRLAHGNPIADVDIRKQSIGQGSRRGAWFSAGGLVIAFVTMIVAIAKQASDTAALAAAGITLLGLAIAIAGLAAMVIDWWTINRASRVRASKAKQS
jgi:hypothetical protein